METGLSGRNGKATKHNAKMPTQAGVAATVNVMFDIFRFHNAHSSLNPLSKAIHPSVVSFPHPPFLSRRMSQIVRRLGSPTKGQAR